MKKDIKLSVVMGVYNEELHWLKDCIESVINQTYSNFEFIIILDNPKNEKIKKFLIKYMQQDNRIRFYINNENIGLVSTLNKGIALATGEYIVRMDADDISYCERFEKQINYLIENPEIDLLGTRVRYITEDGEAIKVEEEKANNKYIKEMLKYTNVFSHPTLVYKKSVVDYIGGYRNALYAEDYDLINRFVINGNKVANMNDILLDYRIRSNGVSRSKRKYQLISTIYIQKIYRKNLRCKVDLFDEKDLKNLINNSDIKNDEFELYSIYSEEKNKIKKLAYIIKLILIRSVYVNLIINRYNIIKLRGKRDV